MKTFGIIYFLLFAFILLEYLFFYTALNSSLMLPPFEQELVMIFTFVMFCTMALSPDGSETCTIAKDDWGPYHTMDECYDRARFMVDDMKRILNVEAEYSYKCEHETGI